MPKRNDDARRSDGRFKPGHCGNPNGRPRKTAASLAETLRDVLNETVTVGSRRMLVSEALVRTLVKHASSNPKAALQLLKLQDNLSASLPHMHIVSPTDDEDTVQAFLDEQRRHARTTSPLGEGDDDDSEQD